MRLSRQLPVLMAVESILHDPATYSTYPAQWFGLLQHLSLSHSLVVLHIRSLSLSTFPGSIPPPFEDDGPISGPYAGPMPAIFGLHNSSLASATRSRSSRRQPGPGSPSSPTGNALLRSSCRSRWLPSPASNIARATPVLSMA